MKAQHGVVVAALLLATVAGANAQCGMMGKGGHKHGDAKAPTQEKHGSHSNAGESKAYAVINDDGMQEVTVLIKDGYHPKTVVVKKGIPLRINFDLQEESCTGTVVFKDFDLKKKLASGKLTGVEFTPDKAGTFAFSCPMEMIQGTLVVKE